MADAPGLTVKIKLQDTSGNVVYTGNPTRSLRLWGATFELGREVDRRFGDFANFYHYVRSLSSAGDYQDSQYLFDARADGISVGGTVAAKVAQTGENPNEYIAFNYIKQARRAGVTDPLGSDNIISADAGIIAFGDGTSVLTNIQSF
jgi:hypothetical protein